MRPPRFPLYFFGFSLSVFASSYSYYHSEQLQPFQCSWTPPSSPDSRLFYLCDQNTYGREKMGLDSLLESDLEG